MIVGTEQNKGSSEQRKSELTDLRKKEETKSLKGNVPLTLVQQRKFIKEEVSEQERQKKADFTRKHMQMLRQRVGPIINQQPGVTSQSVSDKLANNYYTQPFGEISYASASEPNEMIESFMALYKQM